MKHPSHDAWNLAGQRLLTKAIAEFAFEELLLPIPDALAERGRESGAKRGAEPDAEADAEPRVRGQERSYRLEFDAATWTFRASRGTFGVWRVAADTVQRVPVPGADELGPELLLLDARRALGWDGPTTAEVLRELTATRRADAMTLQRALTAAELADLSHLELEAHQDGHPCMVLNKGRLGFSASDTDAYAPESAGEVRLVWVAVHSSLATYSATPELDAGTLLDQELGGETVKRYAAILADACASSGHRPDAFVWLPVHPFHWDEAVRTLFCGYLADGRIVRLGESADRYRPLQSIRTLANLDHPERRNVKVPLMIRNTLVWRGLSPKPTQAAPDISAWLHQLRASDPYLSQELRFHPLGEVAAVAVRHPLYESVADAPYRYHELFGAVWREPVSALLSPGERARTMAALLSEGSDGRALVSELVARSGLSAANWLRRFLGALLPGLLHYLYRYGVAFCPHGENTVVLYDGRDVPIGVAVKDFAEDVNLLPEDLPEYAWLTERAREVLLRWPAHELAHSVLSAVFAGHFRFFAPLVADHLDVAEDEFWAMVRAEVERYHVGAPELAGRFADFGLLADEFDRVALNREQLLGGGFHDRAERDEGFDVVHGQIGNPLAAAATSTDLLAAAESTATAPEEQQ